MPRRRLRLDPDRFAALVEEAMATIPEEFRRYLANVAVCIEDEPSAEQLASLGLDPEIDTLFGLYTGTPIDQRGAAHPALPDHIAIYYLPLTDEFDDEYHLRREIRRTVVHEIGHHFGFSDHRLRGMGY